MILLILSSHSLSNTRAKLVSATGGNEELLVQDPERHSGGSWIVRVQVSHLCSAFLGESIQGESFKLYIISLFLDSLLIPSASVTKARSKSVSPKKSPSKSNRYKKVGPIHKMLYTCTTCIPVSAICSGLFIPKPSLSLLSTSSLTKRKAKSASKAKAFKIDKIIQKQSYGPVYADRESKSHFGVEFENNFLLSDDGHYLIAPDASDGRRILVEDLRKGSWFRFGENKKVILTLFFDEDSRTLLAGDRNGHLVEYELDLENNKGRTTKKHGDLKIGWIRSSSGAMGLVLLGGSRNNARVYDLSSKKVLSGDIETAIGYIFSLQVCVVDKSRLYMAVVGYNSNYSSTESDLYDLEGLLGKVSVPGSVRNNAEHLLTQRESNTMLTKANQMKSSKKSWSDSRKN